MSVQNFPDMIFSLEKKLHGKHEGKLFWKQKTFVILLFQLYKRKQDCTKVFIKIALPNVYGSARVFEVLVWGTLFLSYMLGEKIDFSFFSKIHKEIHRNFISMSILYVRNYCLQFIINIFVG